MTPKSKPAPVSAEPTPVELSEIPAGTREVLWVIAAAWAGTTVSQLLADTAPVKAVHYAAAERVEKAFDTWDLAQGYEDTSQPTGSQNALVETYLSMAADALMTAAPTANEPETSSRYAACAADIYGMMHNLRSLPKVRVAK